ncbi:hypothetical protein H4582DRAFT_680542 [Lactarius indigo]|nr:hypothetical protein H4582DRAFT_680542 [Lactarius indigo]
MAHLTRQPHFLHCRHTHRVPHPFRDYHQFKCPEYRTALRCPRILRFMSGRSLFVTQIQIMTAHELASLFSRVHQLPQLKAINLTFYPRYGNRKDGAGNASETASRQSSLPSSHCALMRTATSDARIFGTAFMIFGVWSIGALTLLRPTTRLTLWRSNAST